MNKFGKNLKYLRNSYGESLMDLSIVLDKNTSTISQWESGKRTPNVDMLRSIAKHYKVTIDELLTSDLSNLSSWVDYFVNVKDNKDYIKSVYFRIFPIIARESDKQDLRFMRALTIHKKLFKGEADLHDNEYDEMFEIYSVLFEDEQSLAAGANLLSLFFTIASTYSALPFIDELDDYLNSDIKRNKIQDAKFFITNYFLGIDNFVDEEMDITELDELVLEIIGKLKSDIRFSQIADYYFSLRYLFGFVDYTFGSATTTEITAILLQDLSTLNNAYARRFLVFFRNLIKR